MYEGMYEGTRYACITSRTYHDESRAQVETERAEHAADGQRSTQRRFGSTCDACHPVIREELKVVAWVIDGQTCPSSPRPGRVEVIHGQLDSVDNAQALPIRWCGWGECVNPCRKAGLMGGMEPAWALHVIVVLMSRDHSVIKVHTRASGLAVLLWWAVGGTRCRYSLRPGRSYGPS